jgi:hypothetical protein
MCAAVTARDSSQIPTTVPDGAAYLPNVVLCWHLGGASWPVTFATTREDCEVSPNVTLTLAFGRDQGAALDTPRSKPVRNDQWLSEPAFLWASITFSAMCWGTSS